MSDINHSTPRTVPVPVDAAAAPIRIGGIPNTSRIIEATTHVTLAVVKEEAARVLWWRHWNPILPRAWIREGGGWK